MALFLSPIETTICTTLLLSLTSQPPPNNDMRSLFSQPCRLGGLDIPIPTESSSVQYLNSVTITSPLMDLVLDQHDHIPCSVLSTLAETKRSLHNTNHQTQLDRATSIYSSLSSAQHLGMHFVFAMDGNLPFYPPCVFVVPRLPSTMHSTAIVVDFLH